MLGRQGQVRWLSGLAGAVALLAACGGEISVFTNGPVGTGGARGVGGSDPVGPTTTTGEGGSTTSAGGSAPMCVDDEDCLALDQTCSDYGCDEGICTVLSYAPEGTPCGMDMQCDGQGICEDATLLGLGSPCSDGAMCGSGQCVDGFCCESTCEGECLSCGLPSLEGTCSPHPAGSDPEGDCGGGVCDGAAACANGDVLWAGTYGSFFDQLGHSVAADSGGNVVVAGHHFNDLDFGNGVLDSAGNRDVFVAKLDPTGNALWSLRAGDGQGQYAWDVEIDDTDAVVVTGYHYGSLDLGGGTLTSSSLRDPFLAKYDAMGNHLWSQSFDGDAEDLARATATGPGGVIAMAGYFQSDLNLGGNTFTSAGDLDIFVGVYDAAGNHSWSSSFGDGAEDRAFDVAFDSQGNLFMTGRFFGTVDFGNGILTSAGSTDGFIAKFSPTGTVLWAAKIGDGAPQYVRGVAVDANDDVWLAGYGGGTFSVAGGPALTSAGGWDVFVAKLDGATGSHVDSQMFPGTDDQVTRDLVIDGSGNVIVGGYYEDNPDFGNGILANDGFIDAFIIKLAPSGTLLWSYGFGGPNTQIGHGVAVDPSGNAFLTGYFDNSIEFGADPIASTGGSDVFLTKLSP